MHMIRAKETHERIPLKYRKPKRNRIQSPLLDHFSVNGFFRPFLSVQEFFLSYYNEQPKSVDTADTHHVSRQKSHIAVAVS